jgi:hypothetical protein
VRVLLVLLALVAVARADDKALAKYKGQLVVAKDAPPTTAGELPKYLEENWSKDGHYDLIGGSPWDMNIVAVLAKDADKATLVFTDAGKPLQEVEVAVKSKLVVTHVKATKAAGFEPHKIYGIELRRGDAVLAKADVMLRE